MGVEAEWDKFSTELFRSMAGLWAGWGARKPSGCPCLLSCSCAEPDRARAEHEITTTPHLPFHISHAPKRQTPATEARHPSCKESS